MKALLLAAMTALALTASVLAQEVTLQNLGQKVAEALSAYAEFRIDYDQDRNDFWVHILTKTDAQGHQYEANAYDDTPEATFNKALNLLAIVKANGQHREE